MSASLKLPFDLTVEQFFEWCPNDNVRWQLVDGEPQAMAPTRPRHGLLQAEITRIIGNHLLETGRPCNVVDAPGVVPELRASKNLRIPDLGVTCTPPSGEDRSLREPVVLIEILSPSNRRETWANVWAYTTISTVQDIVVFHVEERRAELLRRRQDGAWPVEPAQVKSGDLVLESIGFRGPLESFYRTVGS